jgi:anti-sigma regulatory factor (Ser/Thr protein kinase)
VAEQRTVSARLDSSTAAARLGREACRPLLSLMGERQGDLDLLVTELVTNSVQHARVKGEASIGLEVAVDHTHARVEVSDGGAGFTPPAPNGFDANRTGGWGLVMVDHLCDDWGVFVDGGTHVWAELPHSGSR